MMVGTVALIACSLGAFPSYSFPRNNGARVATSASFASPMDAACAALGVKPGASMPEIRNAYHNLAKMYHPDKVQGTTSSMIELPDGRWVSRERLDSKFREITDAFELLSSAKRSRTASAANWFDTEAEQRRREQQYRAGGRRAEEARWRAEELRTKQEFAQGWQAWQQRATHERAHQARAAQARADQVRAAQARAAQGQAQVDPIEDVEVDVEVWVDDHGATAANDVQAVDATWSEVDESDSANQEDEEDEEDDDDLQVEVTDEIGEQSEAADTRSTRVGVAVEEEAANEVADDQSSGSGTAKQTLERAVHLLTFAEQKAAEVAEKIREVEEGVEGIKEHVDETAEAAIDVTASAAEPVVTRDAVGASENATQQEATMGQGVVADRAQESVSAEMEARMVALRSAADPELEKVFHRLVEPATQAYLRDEIDETELKRRKAAARAEAAAAHACLGEAELAFNEYCGARSARAAARAKLSKALDAYNQAIHAFDRTKSVEREAEALLRTALKRVDDAAGVVESRPPATRARPPAAKAAPPAAKVAPPAAKAAPPAAKTAPAAAKAAPPAAKAHPPAAKVRPPVAKARTPAPKAPPSWKAPTSTAPGSVAESAARAAEALAEEDPDFNPFVSAPAGRKRTPSSR